MAMFAADHPSTSCEQTFVEYWYKDVLPNLMNCWYVFKLEIFWYYTSALEVNKVRECEEAATSLT